MTMDGSPIIGPAWGLRNFWLNEGHSFGILDSVTDESGDVDSSNLFVGRFSKNLFDQSDVGVIFTHGDPTSNDPSYTVGTDLNLRTDSFQGDKNLRFTVGAGPAGGEQEAHACQRKQAQVDVPSIQQVGGEKDVEDRQRRSEQQQPDEHGDPAQCQQQCGYNEDE